MEEMLLPKITNICLIVHNMADLSPCVVSFHSCKGSWHVIHIFYMSILVLWESDLVSRLLHLWLILHLLSDLLLPWSLGFFFHLYNQGWLCIDCLSWIEWASLGQPPHPNLIDLARVPSPGCSACIWLSHQIRRINCDTWIKRDKEGIRPQAPIFKFHCPRCQSWDID